MGKKKSVALMVLLTIVIIALCAITAFPAFSVPGTVEKWNPAVLQYDFGADLSGGYYAYYYPEGVKTETEYNNLDAEEQKGYTLHEGGLYLSNDNADNILDAEGKVTDEFEAAFEAAQEGDTIDMFVDVEATEVILIDKSLTINGNGHNKYLLN